MQNRTSGPDFERSPEQRVVIGPYEPRRPRQGAPEAPRSPRPTLVERLKARILGDRTGTRQRGPSFRRPKGTGPFERAD